MAMEWLFRKVLPPALLLASPWHCEIFLFVCPAYLAVIHLSCVFINWGCIKSLVGSRQSSLVRLFQLSHSDTPAHWRCSLLLSLSQYQLLQLLLLLLRFPCEYMREKQMCSILFGAARSPVIDCRHTFAILLPAQKWRTKNNASSSSSIVFFVFSLLLLLFLPR